jgi:hypothetical protein
MVAAAKFCHDGTMRSTVPLALVCALVGTSLATLALAQPSEPPANPPAVITAPPDAPVAAPQSPAAAPQSPAAAPIPRLPTPGETIGSIGRFIDQSISNVGAGIKGAGDAVGDAGSVAGDVAKDVGSAAGAVARLPLSNTVSGWEPCPTAANGAPDCERASVALCKAKGFTAGRSVDITSSQKCPAAVWLEKRQPTAGECRDEAFVSKAICQ